MKYSTPFTLSPCLPHPPPLSLSLSLSLSPLPLSAPHPFFRCLSAWSDFSLIPSFPYSFYPAQLVYLALLFPSSSSNICSLWVSPRTFHFTMLPHHPIFSMYVYTTLPLPSHSLPSSLSTNV